MSDPPISSIFQRYLAIDAHKHYVVVGGLNVGLEIVLPARRMEIEHYPQWAKENLTLGDCLVIEASTNTWDLYDATAAVAGKVVVAHPLEVKLIANARVKTDKEDVYRLARLLAGNLIPEVWVPPVVVRELRTLVAHRQRMIKLRTMTRKRRTAAQNGLPLSLVIPMPLGGCLGGACLISILHVFIRLYYGFYP